MEFNLYFIGIAELLALIGQRHLSVRSILALLWFYANQFVARYFPSSGHGANVVVLTFEEQEFFSFYFPFPCILEGAAKFKLIVEAKGIVFV